MRRLKEKLKGLLDYVKSHKKIDLVILIALAIILFFLLPKSGSPVLTQKVTRQDVVKTVSVTGNISANNSVNLTFQTAGTLSYLGVKKGDSVKAYQEIAGLDQRTVSKNLQTALLNYSEQRNTFDQTLQNNNAKQISDAANDTIKRILQDNQYDLQKAVLSVELSDLVKQESVLVTPISGIVTRMDVTDTGLSVTPTTVFTVTDPSSLAFSMDVDEADIGNVQNGQDVNVSLDSFPNTTLKLKVSRIDFVSHTTSSGGNAFTVTANLPSNPNYRVGMSGNADIIVDSKSNVLSISSSSVTDDNYVFVKVGNQFEKRKVSLGLQSDTQAQVLSGLSEGEEVALDPSSVPPKLIKK